MQQAARHPDDQEMEKLLCRTIIRLTLATSGLDATLDPHLTGLRDAVRRGCGPGDWEQIAALSEDLLRAKGPESGAVAGAADPDLFGRLINRIRLTGAAARRLRLLAREMRAAPGKVTDGQLDELLELLRSEPESGGAGLFGRLFGGGRAADGAGSSPEHPNQLLLQLLGKLNWPDQLRDDIALLAERLSHDAEATAWVGVIEELTHLMATALEDVQSEIHATEGFLRQLTRRLQEIDQHVNNSEADHQSAVEDSVALNRVVRGKVGGIQRSMHSATSIRQLVDDIGGSLDAIQNHVESHVKAEIARHQRALETERQLRERLHKMEQDAGELRKKMLDTYRRASVDSVTGLPNRLAYEERLPDEYARWKRFSTPLTLAVWDVDNFKHINDRFGHRAGDKALRVIAQILRRRLRQTDFVARYGGEEFVMLLAGADTTEASELIEQTRLAVQESGFHSGEHRIEVTISCGFSEFTAGDTPDTVFERADRALYDAKRQGKNCCIKA